MANGTSGPAVGNVDLVTAARGATQNIGQLVQAFNALSTALAGSATNIKLSAQGFQQFSSGLILNWGTGSTASGTGSVSYGLPFTTACFLVALTVTGSASASDNALIASSSPGLSACSVYSASGTSLTFSYLAIGY